MNCGNGAPFRPPHIRCSTVLAAAKAGKTVWRGAAMFNFEEKHYSVQEIAASWHVSTDTVRRLFVDEPGVVIFTRPSIFKRVYRVLRIPQHDALIHAVDDMLWNSEDAVNAL